MTKSKIAAALAGAALLAVSAPALAASHQGKISLYHLNSDVAGRGVCVQMSPVLPGSTWACLWQDNDLYDEITELLLGGYLHNRTCRLTWNGADAHGHNLISIAECLK